MGLILQTCRAAKLQPALVVAGADELSIRKAIAPHPNARLVAHPGWGTGRTSSIQAGLAAMGAVRGLAPTDDVLLWPVDCCLPDETVILALRAAQEAVPEALAWIPSYENRRGHPALFSPVAAGRIAALGPDEPARNVVRALADEGSLVHVDLDDPTVLMNMNTPEDYADWLGVFLTPD